MCACMCILEDTTYRPSHMFLNTYTTPKLIPRLNPKQYTYTCASSPVLIHPLNWLYSYVHTKHKERCLIHEDTLPSSLPDASQIHFGSHIEKQMALSLFSPAQAGCLLPNNSFAQPRQDAGKVVLHPSAARSNLAFSACLSGENPSLLEAAHGSVAGCLASQEVEWIHRRVS